MGISNSLIRMFFSFIVILISSLPLHFSVKFLNGRTNILKTILVSFFSGLLVSAVQNYFRWLGGLIAFLLLIWIYHEIFRLKWWKASIVWLIQLVFVALFYFLMAALALSVFGLAVVL